MRWDEGEQTYFRVRLPDGVAHVAAAGHVNALCGAARVSNADETDGDVTCDACVLALRGRRGR